MQILYSKNKHLNNCIHISMAPDELSSCKCISLCSRQGQWCHALVITHVHCSPSAE